MTGPSHSSSTATPDLELLVESQWRIHGVSAHALQAAQVQRARQAKALARLADAGAVTVRACDADFAVVLQRCGHA